MPVIPFRESHPKIGERVFVAPDAWIIGDTEIGEEASVFFGAVVRGDILPIRIGRCTNLQEHAVLHTSTGVAPCILGEHVTVGHGAIVHGCTVGDRCIIGMGSTILDEASIGEYCMIGANALVSLGTVIPPRSLALGVPARVVRQLSDKELAQIEESARHYCELGAVYREQFKQRDVGNQS